MTTNTKYEVSPTYGAINAIHDICEPWINIWSGDEWGESLSSALSAMHTSYGFTDEDCAIIAEIVLRNVIDQHQWMEEEGHSYGLSEPEQERQASQEAAKARDYWLKGGNLGTRGPTAEEAKSVIDQMPDWMFTEPATKAGDTL